MGKMTTAYLRLMVVRTGSYFFTSNTMKFFGDRMSNYGVRSAGENWELYRRKPVKHGLQESAYFNKETFERVHIIQQKGGR